MSKFNNHSAKTTMNRHQSNPFLADWDDDVSPQTVHKNDPSIFDDDSIEPSNLVNDKSAAQNPTTRRHSSSNSNITDATTNRRADRRLYHRNMSSFEVASLHQQLTQENGALDDPDAISSELARMTAEFKSAINKIDAKDKDNSLGDAGAGDGYDDDDYDINRPIDGFNPFDPFETIVDDDIAYPSPANATQHEPTTGNKDADSFATISQVEDAEREADAIISRMKDDLVLPFDDSPTTTGSTSKPKHDSIDDDDEELISTPVRNIKSSANNSTHNDNATNQNEPGSEINNLGKQARDRDDANSGLDSQDNPNSREKAHLYATLLDSAESQSAKIPNDNNLNCLDSGEIANSDLNEDSSADYARVIRGSPTALNGNIDRPVGFFDPFETVIDRDALTSMCNETLANSKTSQIENSNQAEQSEEHEQKQEKHGDSSSDQVKTGETHRATTTPSATNSNSNNNYCAIPRPRARPTASGDKQPTPFATPIRRAPKSTPVKQRATKRRVKVNENEDSDDSSDSSEDEHLKIVIKARSDLSTDAKLSSAGEHGEHGEPAAAGGSDVMAPILLLPPPPTKESIMQAMQEEAAQAASKRDRKKKTKKTKPGSGSASSSSFSSDSSEDEKKELDKNKQSGDAPKKGDEIEGDEEEDEDKQDQFIIRMTHSDEEALGEDGFDGSSANGDGDEPLYDHDTTYKLEEFNETPASGFGWNMLLRYPPKKKFTSNRFWKEIGVKVEEVPVAQDSKQASKPQQQQTCIALQILNKLDEKKPMQEIPLQPTYTVSEISSQQLDQFGKLFTVKLQYIFYKERVGVRQGQLARFIHGSGTSTTSGGHGIDPLSIGAIKRLGAPIEHSPQISQIIKLGSTNYNDIKQFKNCLEDHLFKMPIQRDRALATYKTEEIQMLVRDETYIELNQVGQITRQLARVRLFFLSFLNGTPTIEVGINDIHRQGREVVGRMDILPVITEEWIRLEACELHSSVDQQEFENAESRLIKFVPPDATFFELMRFRVRPPRNRELPLQISANMSVTRTKIVIDVNCVVAGSVSRKMGPIPCEFIAIRVPIPDCWIYQFREEKHFRMGSKKSVKNTPGRIKGMGRFLGGAAPSINPGSLSALNHPGDQANHPGGGGGGGESNGVIEVTSGQAKYEHHHKAIVWRAAKWPKDNQTAYVTNSMKIYLTLTAYDQMPSSFEEFLNVEYCMPATTVSHTSLRSISVNPCEDEPPEKFVKYLAKYEYKCKMRLSVNLQTPGQAKSGDQANTSGTAGKGLTLFNEPKISLKREPDKSGDLQREEDSEDDDDDEDDDEDDDMDGVHKDAVNNEETRGQLGHTPNESN